MSVESADDELEPQEYLEGWRGEIFKKVHGPGGQLRIEASVQNALEDHLTPQKISYRQGLP